MSNWRIIESGVGEVNLENRISGAVATIGATGALVTDIENEKLSDVPRDESVTISFGDHQTLGIFPADHGEPDSTLVASLGESGYLELGIVGLNLSEMLGIKVGEPVIVAW